MVAPNALYLRLANLIWLAWLLSWIIAAAWSRRTIAAAPRSSFRLQLGLAFIGFVCLFADRPGAMRPLWPVAGWVGGALVGLVAAGIAFAWWARIHLGPLWSGGVVARQGHRIVESGPYGLVRHPIYTGLILAAGALAAIKATVPALLGALLIGLGFALKARVEEHFLAGQLGAADYQAYRARVPMLVPFGPPHR